MEWLKKYGFRLGLLLLVGVHAYMVWNGYNGIGLDADMSLYHGLFFAIAVPFILYKGDKTSLI